jgi:protein gp37
MARRLAGRVGYPKDNPFQVTLHPERLDEPARVKRPKRIFVVSMGDLFHHHVPVGFIYDILHMATITAPQHTYYLLTKRPARMAECVAMWNEHPGFSLENVWFGVSVEDQDTTEERLPLLASMPVANRFVSVEPMLGPVRLPEDCNFGNCRHCNPKWPGVDWVICGGETGPKARPMHPQWVRDLRDQCMETGTPFFLKHMGEWIHEQAFADEWILKCREYQWPDGTKSYRVANAGHLLDGKAWRQIP